MANGSGSTRSILVKGSLPAGGLSFSIRRDDFQTQPLFRSIGQPDGLGAADSSTWHIITPTSPMTGANAWDLCHELLQRGFGVAGVAPPEFAEPDIEQRWVYGNETDQTLRLASACDSPAPPNPSFPSLPNLLWYSDGDHGDFPRAPAAGSGVLVAHLDTGYDPNHHTRPTGLLSNLARNFVDPDRPNDATDVTPGGVLKNPGHGTGTLGILAGKSPDGNLPPTGAAPGVGVVPVRVANSVVLFRNSSIAQALDYVHSLLTNPATRVHVVTMSMGGLASQAWAEAVNALYDKGVFIVTAAGNNYGNLPTRNIVFPARFRRVAAACGIMANHQPYADLNWRLMAGNYGPDSKMDTAVSAYTPNTPWARLGCESIVDADGAGTSSSTPQIAAAAALWIAKNRARYEAYSQPWMRIEAVRSAIFHTAISGDRKRLGWGSLESAHALAFPPPDENQLKQQAPDSAAFPLLRALTGLGIAAEPADPRERMLELEALQLSQTATIEKLLSDPDDPTLDPKRLQAVREALASDPRASSALRDALGASPRGAVAVPSVAKISNVSSTVDKLHLTNAVDPVIPPPERRNLRVFAADPSLEAELSTLSLNEGLVAVKWEKLEPGPVGEYIEVIDVDPSSRCAYAPVDLDNPHLLVQNGLRPSEANAQFHQQMVYAVSMKTIEHFERALGRVALWSPRFSRTPAGAFQEEYVQRLRIYPHALRDANAFYSPDKKALLLGYFPAAGNAGVNAPGTLIFGCLSYDIIAHETTHALLDGLHRRYREPTNLDMLAFHEAFADIVALFQHFTLPEALRDQIRKTRGDLGQQNLLAELAYQFGQATSGRRALRDFLGGFEAGVWKKREPKPTDYASATEPHARGSVLVAAVFDAFLKIYTMCSADLIRLATNGTGILPAGDISTDLAERLAQEASKVAGQWLNICIRALDYAPPVDITFGDYLRALITADRDLVPDDKLSYRVAFVSAFRARGIYPEGVRHLSVTSLAWEPPPQPLKKIGAIVKDMSLAWNLSAKRRGAFYTSHFNAGKFHTWLMSGDVSDEEIAALGFVRGRPSLAIGGVDGRLRRIEVHSVRPARRIGPDGQGRTDLVVEITQAWDPSQPGYPRMRGGATLLVDLETNEVRYFIRKRVDHPGRFATQMQFAEAMSDGSLRANYFDDGLGREPFAMLHRLNQIEEDAP